MEYSFFSPQFCPAKLVKVREIDRKGEEKKKKSQLTFQRIPGWASSSATPWNFLALSPSSFSFPLFSSSRYNCISNTHSGMDMTCDFYFKKPDWPLRLPILSLSFGLSIHCFSMWFIDLCHLLGHLLCLERWQERKGRKEEGRKKEALFSKKQRTTDSFHSIQQTEKSEHNETSPDLLPFQYLLSKVILLFLSISLPCVRLPPPHPPHWPEGGMSEKENGMKRRHGKDEDDIVWVCTLFFSCSFFSFMPLSSLPLSPLAFLSPSDRFNQHPSIFVTCVHSLIHGNITVSQRYERHTDVDMTTDPLSWVTNSLIRASFCPFFPPLDLFFLYIASFLSLWIYCCIWTEEKKNKTKWHRTLRNETHRRVGHSVGHRSKGGVQRCEWDGKEK